MVNNNDNLFLPQKDSKFTNYEDKKKKEWQGSPQQSKSLYTIGLPFHQDNNYNIPRNYR